MGKSPRESLEKTSCLPTSQALVGGDRLTPFLADAALEGSQHREQSLVEGIDQRSRGIDPNLEALR
jgi:hypothetical protein